MSAYVKRLADYDIERLTEAVDAMFTASAFYGRIKPHMTVILKPNLVMRSAPEEAIITHPNVTVSVLQRLPSGSCTAVLLHAVYNEKPYFSAASV